MHLNKVQSWKFKHKESEIVAVLFSDSVNSYWINHSTVLRPWLLKDEETIVMMSVLVDTSWVRNMMCKYDDRVLKSHNHR